MGSASKVLSLQEAVARYVHDGDSVYLAGFTHLIPFAAGHEMIRQGRRNLTLCRATPDLIYDQMIQAGCARKVVFSWAGNPGVGLLHAFRREVEAGRLEIEEYSHFGMAARLAAGASGLPFMPMMSNAGSDLVRHNPNIRFVSCPYTGSQISVVPALTLDVAVIHVQRADQEGNAQVWGIVGEQMEAALAARRVIVTTEEIVEPGVIAADPNRTLIPGLAVSAVVETPWGAHPSYAQGYYDRDNEFYMEWDRISRDPQSYDRWLQEWVYEVDGPAAYADKLGPQKLLALRPDPCYSTSVNYGLYPQK